MNEKYMATRFYFSVTDTHYIAQHLIDCIEKVVAS